MTPDLLAGVASDVPHRILKADGHTPTRLEEFSAKDRITLTICFPGPQAPSYPLVGCTEPLKDGASKVEFKQKEGTGADRTWQIEQCDDGLFYATPQAAI